MGNSWRTTEDIYAGKFQIIFKLIHLNYESREAAKPGAWNDPDMLEIGNGGLTNEEEKTHFALWALSKAPLLIGCDLDKISDSSLKVLRMKNLIAVNQDSSAYQAKCVYGCVTKYPNKTSTVPELEKFVPVEGPSIWKTEDKNGNAIVMVTNWKNVTVNNY